MERDLIHVLERRAADGGFVYSDDDLRAVFPILCMGIVQAFPDARLPPHAIEAIGEMSRAAGVAAGDTREATAAKVKAWVDGLQVGRALIDELERVMRGALGGGNLDAARAIAGALGVTLNNKPLESGVRPEGTVPAGPAARFAALRKVPPKT